MFKPCNGTRRKWAQCTQHIPFGKDDNIFSNYKQIFAKNTEICKKKQHENFFNF